MTYLSWWGACISIIISLTLGRIPWYILSWTSCPPSGMTQFVQIKRLCIIISANRQRTLVRHIFYTNSEFQTHISENTLTSSQSDSTRCFNMLPDKTPPLKLHTEACGHSFGGHPNHVETSSALLNTNYARPGRGSLQGDDGGWLYNQRGEHRQPVQLRRHHLREPLQEVGALPVLESLSEWHHAASGVSSSEH